MLLRRCRWWRRCRCPALASTPVPLLQPAQALPCRRCRTALPVLGRLASQALTLPCSAASCYRGSTHQRQTLTTCCPPSPAAASSSRASQAPISTCTWLAPPMPAQAPGLACRRATRTPPGAARAVDAPRAQRPGSPLLSCWCPCSLPLPAWQRCCLLCSRRACPHVPRRRLWPSLLAGRWPIPWARQLRRPLAAAPPHPPLPPATARRRPGRRTASVSRGQPSRRLQGQHAGREPRVLPRAEGRPVPHCPYCFR